MPSSDRRTRNLLIFGFCLGILSLAFVGVAVAVSANQFVRTAEAVSKHQSILDAASDARRALVRAETEQRGFLLTGNSEYLEVFDQAPEELGAALEKLRRELGPQEPNLAAAERAAWGKLKEMRLSLAAYANGGEAAAKSVVATREGLVLMSQFRAAIARVEEHQRQALARDARANLENRRRVGQTVVFGLLFAGVLVITCMAMVLRDLRRRTRAEMKLKSAVDDLQVAAERLKESRDVALAATRTKSEFLANMSHEIRTPMNGVLGMAHLLESTPLDDRQRTFVRNVISSAESLLTILNDILDVSKMEAGKLSLEHFPFDLRELVEDVCEVQAPTAHEKGLEINCIYPPELPRAVSGDPNRLRQILTNLVSNAIKFTSKGEVNVRLGLVRTGEDSASFRFSVVDTGIGIPRDRQDHVFESFTQADGSTSRTYGGTGLGLTICRQLVQLMGGEMGVLSEEGKGSEFWFEIPLALSSNAATLSGPEHALAGRTILVVDDNQTNRNVIRGLLEHWQCRVKEAQDGFYALEAIDLDGDIDAALLDMHMPRMDGAELARKIRARSEGRGVPLVLLSSSGLGTGDLDDAGLFSSIIFKPIRSVPLARALAQALEPESEATVKRQETGSDRGELQSLRVLVVEDNSINQIVATEYLNRWGCDVTVAENGEVAIRLTETQRFDAILMDVQMPVLDGFAATRKIREREATSGEHVPIFAMTANAMSGDRERCLQAGMDGYLPKPLQPTVLLKELQAVARPNERIEMAQSETMSDGEVEPQLFDPGRLDESCAGKTSLKLRVIEKYITSSEASLETIEVAASQGDHASLAGGAHALKGSSLTIGSPAVSELCEQVERAAGRREVARAEIAKLRPTMAALTDRLTAFAEELRAQG